MFNDATTFKKICFLKVIPILFHNRFFYALLKLRYSVNLLNRLMYFLKLLLNFTHFLIKLGYVISTLRVKKNYLEE